MMALIFSNICLPTMHGEFKMNLPIYYLSANMFLLFVIFIQVLILEHLKFSSIIYNVVNIIFQISIIASTF